MPKTKRKLGRIRKTKSKTVKHRRKTFRRVKKYTKRIRGGTDFGCTYIREIKEGLEESCDMISAFDAVMDSCRDINGQKDKLTEKLQTLRFEKPKERKRKIKKEFIDFINKADSSDTSKNIFNTFYKEKGEAIIKNFEENFNISFSSYDKYKNSIRETVGSCLEEEDIVFYNSVLDYFKQKVNTIEQEDPPTENCTNKEIEELINNIISFKNAFDEYKLEKNYSVETYTDFKKILKFIHKRYKYLLNKYGDCVHFEVEEKLKQNSKGYDINYFNILCPPDTVLLDTGECKSTSEYGHIPGYIPPDINSIPPPLPPPRRKKNMEESSIGEEAF